MAKGFTKEEEKKPVLAGSGKKQYYVGPNPSKAGAGRGAGYSDAAEKIDKLREMAKDKTLPQEVRNTYLDQAVKIEEKAAMKSGVKLAKGGMAKELPKRGQRTATNMAKGGSVAKKGKK